MMDLSLDGREVCVRLRHDVWQLKEPGTLCLSREQVALLRMHLNQLIDSIELADPDEDG